jgi:hypothetical protein
MGHRNISFKHHNISTLDGQVVWVVREKEAYLQDLGGENGRKIITWRT